MRVSLSLCMFVLVASSLLHGASKNPADYPLRIHIFRHSRIDFYRHRDLEEAKGEGRANLFENGMPRAMEFTYDCSQKLKDSFGYETYPAKWKKPNQDLIVLLPVFGKSNAYFTCHLHTAVKDYAYARNQFGLVSESIPQFKAWMVKRDYDPEHGKNIPTPASPKTPTPKLAAASGQ